MKNKNKKNGFTLLEMIVVVGVFGILIVATVEIFITLYNVGQKTNVSRNLTQDVRQATETISRDVRDSTELLVYPSTNTQHLPHLNEIHLKRQDNSALIYACEDGSGNKCSDATPGSIVMKKKDLLGNITEVLKLTKSETRVTEFIMRWTTSFSSGHPHKQQPRARFRVIAKSDYKDRAGVNPQITIQATASQRKNDVTYCDLFPCGPTIITKLHPVFPDAYISLFSLSNNRWLFNIRMPFDDYINGSGGIIVKKNKVYAFYRNHFWFLDINTRSWVRINNTPFFPDAGEFTSNYDTGQIYFMTGEDTGEVGDNGLKIWRYDDVVDSWTKLGGNHPHPRLASNLGVEYHKGKIYTTGHRNVYQSTNGPWLCFSYDLSTETWSREPNLLYESGIGPGGIVSVGDYLYLLGYTYLDNYQIFWRRNPETGVSERLADTILPTTNHQRRATLTKGVDYIYGASVNDLTRYSINFNNWAPVTSLPYDLGRGRIRFYYVD